MKVIDSETREELDLTFSHASQIAYLRAGDKLTALYSASLSIPDCHEVNQLIVKGIRIVDKNQHINVTHEFVLAP